ncbi:MAG: hypothetical protein K1X78_07305 [Verrucomicrobiaceae bacterium]|nr:hypothetical protein [Verrucomicrobiaceae bacterium]
MRRRIDQRARSQFGERQAVSDEGTALEHHLVALAVHEDAPVPRHPLDWNDVRGILVRQGTSNLDWPYIQHQLQPLCEIKEAAEIIAQLEKLRREVALNEGA